MALLVFGALDRVSTKTKCAICGSAFYTDAQREEALCSAPKCEIDDFCSVWGALHKASVVLKLTVGVNLDS